MKIERINENQIRCTLNSFDLSVRNMNLGELAYGTEKARNLFREMIQKASAEVGFDAEDIPLMVEAIPLSNESVMLVITKIEDPEELDTRFAKFTPTSDDEDDDTDFLDLLKEHSEGADDIMNAFRSLAENKAKAGGIQDTGEETDPDQSDSGSADDTAAADAGEINMVRIFCFASLNQVSAAAQVLNEVYWGENTLYKDPKEGLYYLVVNKSSHTPQEFNKVFNILSEYGRKVKNASATIAYYEEHFEVIIKNSALQILASI